MSAREPQNLLVQAMLLMASADGDVAPEEVAVIKGIFATLPPFGELTAPGDFNAVVAEVKTQFKFGVEPAIMELRALRATGLHRKCYVLAAEVAFAHDGLNTQEEKMLSFIGRVLKIQEPFADAVKATLAAKYAG